MLNHFNKFQNIKKFCEVPILIFYVKYSLFDVCVNVLKKKKWLKTNVSKLLFIYNKTMLHIIIKNN